MRRKPFDPNLIPLPVDVPPKPTGPLTVSQLTGLIKQAIETSIPPTVHVVGEVSNLKRHSSGHLYFTLKDASAELSCVMWRSAAASLKFQPGDGMEVVATGGIEVFERAGRYQLYVRRLEPCGVGALDLAFRQLCEKLQREGLFDPKHKKLLPPFPSRIALVTSPTGAAVADMLRTIQRRYPCVDVLLYPVRVQGDGAAGEIAAAIKALNANNAALGGIDVMIVGRGGGSLEDLWAFNEEVVARAIFTSRIPMVSAVGHEVDVTIADLVADVRAATPTAAAELVVPVLSDLLLEWGEWPRRLTRAMHHRVEFADARLASLLHRAPIRDPFIPVRARGQLVDELGNRVERSTSQRLRFNHRRLTALESVVQRIAPHRHLMHRMVQLRDDALRLERAMARRLTLVRRGLNETRRRLDRISPDKALSRRRDRVTVLAETMNAAAAHRLILDRERLGHHADCLLAMSYKSVLGRGFSITRLKRRRVVVRSVRDVHEGERLATEVADGEMESTVHDVRQMELFE